MSNALPTSCLVSSVNIAKLDWNIAIAIERVSQSQTVVRKECITILPLIVGCLEKVMTLSSVFTLETFLGWQVACPAVMNLFSKKWLGGGSHFFSGNLILVVGWQKLVKILGQEMNLVCMKSRRGRPR